MNIPRARPLRCTVVWLATTAVAVLAAAALRGDAVAIASGPGRDLATALVRVGALAALGCVVWAWLAASAVVLEALRGRGGVSLGLPAPVRRALLGACGVALAGSLAAAPAGADPDLGGLPLPDRATSAPPSTARPAEPPRALVVRRGDSLWALAAADLGPHATPAAVDDRWRLIHALNRSVIGPDPDLIRPGQQLRLPTPTEEPS